jgi:hypothetical protein
MPQNHKESKFHKDKIITGKPLCNLVPLCLRYSFGDTRSALVAKIFA